MRTAAVAILAGSLAAGACARPAALSRKTDVYLYADTRRLVDFVEGAARLVEERGTGAFQEFARADSAWRASPTYLFAYDAGGTCVYHGQSPELVGKNLLSLKDAMGKPVIRFVVDVAARKERDAADWIFYLWEDKTDFMPTWKSSYVRKAVAPDGTTYLVGSGSSRVKVEKLFVEEQVDAAARLLAERGVAAAFEDLKTPASRFHFLGTFVFVLDERGHSLVDPAYPTREGRDMSGFRDAVGRLVMREVLSKLTTKDEAWEQFLWPKPGERLPSRRLMYVRKVNVSGRTLLVGSDFYLATPIWMRA